jgi:hypothetical protein
MALKTLALVSADTFSAPFTTRDTVAMETPASLATSFALLAMEFPPVFVSIFI